ncbi:hypothetical protein ColKHC_08961 [Colletotrichum higginsianum]|nr:hypothetical protein ColKHC_08961 [Colletotrichum higginsianum]
MPDGLRAKKQSSSSCDTLPREGGLDGDERMFEVSLSSMGYKRAWTVRMSVDRWPSWSKTRDP